MIRTACAQLLALPTIAIHWAVGPAYRFATPADADALARDITGAAHNNTTWRIDTSRLSLQPLRDGTYAKDLLALSLEPGTLQYVFGMQAGLRGRCGDHRVDRFAVTGRENAAFHGFIALETENNGKTSLVYALKKAARGNGFMTEAVSGLCEWGFSFRRLKSIYAAVAPDNRASRAVLTRAGFTPRAQSWQERLSTLDICDSYVLRRH